MQSLVSQLTKPSQTLSTTRILHAFIIKNRLTVDPFYATKILRFYAINHDLLSARHLFDTSPERSVYLWNSIIRAHAQAHHFPDAFFLFKRMLTSEIPPDNFTFACLARACSDKNDAMALKVLHGKAIAFGLGHDFICSSALVSCYSKLGFVKEASFSFCGIDGKPDLVLCNAMVSCYGSSGDWIKGMQLFKEMMEMAIMPDGYTVVGVITGLTHPNSLNAGEMIHAFCVKCGLDSSDHVGSVLVGLYSRCRRLELACRVFQNLVYPDLVSWSALIAGFSQSGDHVKAMVFFKEFLMFGKWRADPPLLAMVLAASAQSGVVGPGCEIHGYAIRHGCDTDVAVASALIDMYAKCGFLETGVVVFKNMPKRNLVSYNTVILNLGLYGRADEALGVFDGMLEAGMRPDGATFGGILCACCHSGLVEEGRRFFRAMREEFAIEAQTEHYVYMVRLLGMDGRLEEAYDLVKSLPEPVDCGVWGALLSCCECYRSHELIEVIAKHLLEIEPRNSGYNVMVSNLFARIGRWECVEKLRVGDVGANGKVAGSSWISS